MDLNVEIQNAEMQNFELHVEVREAHEVFHLPGDESQRLEQLMERYDLLLGEIDGLGRELDGILASVSAISEPAANRIS